MAPNTYRRETMIGLIVGIPLWAISFVPLGIYVVQPKILQ
jgi:hypothetical protein